MVFKTLLRSVSSGSITFVDFSITNKKAFGEYILQIHTHMCYSNFNDIIHSIIDMDADVITIENSRSDEKLLLVCQEGV